MKKLYEILKSTKAYRSIRYYLKYRVSSKKINSTISYFNSNKLLILDWESTIDEINKFNYSLARFGDGEFACMVGSMHKKKSGLNFCDREIQQRLVTVFTSNVENLMIGILPSPNTSYGYYNGEKKYYFNQYVYALHFNKVIKLLNFSKTYCDATVFLKPLRDDSLLRNQYYNSIKRIWSNRKVCFVSSICGRLDLNHYVFNNINEKDFIDVPKENAYENYTEILTECLTKNKNTLFLLSAGFTATLLAYDLTNFGYQAIDVGHITHI